LVWEQAARLIGWSNTLGQSVRDGALDIVAVPTSTRTKEQAIEEGIKVVSLDEAGWLDVTIDGADEFDA
jgi:ribose 5-phosphate isomerase A